MESREEARNESREETVDRDLRDDGRPGSKLDTDTRPGDPIGDDPRDEVTDSRGEGRLSTADLVREADDVDRDRDDAPSADETRGREPLFAGEDEERFRTRWTEVQTGFVDEPRKAVQDADALVAELMQRLAETFSTERSNLESQWDGDGDVSTEDLRVALQRYRSFFDRLLSA